MEQRCCVQWRDQSSTAMCRSSMRSPCRSERARPPVTALGGLAEIHKLLIENKPRQARLHVLRMQAAFKQFLIDESWVVRSRLLGTEEPPWGHWATQDLQALRRQYVYTRLIEATWVGAHINQPKEEEWLMKKRQAFKDPSPSQPPKPKGNGEAA